MSQTTVQRQNAIRFGSAKLEIGEAVASLIDIGALRNVRIVESWDEVEVQSDNAGVLLQKIRNQKLTINADWLEPDLEILNTIRGGIDTYDTTANSIVEDHDQTIAADAYDFNEFIECEYQNEDGSVLQIDSQGYPDLSGSVDGALAHGDDYFITKNGQGKWGIIIVEAGTTVTTMNQVFTLSYDYTPAASKDLSSGGKFAVSARVVRLTNTNAAGNTVVMTIYRGFNNGPLELPWPSDEGEDAMPMPIEIVAELDVSRTAGDQLYSIVDGQSTT